MESANGGIRKLGKDVREADERDDERARKRSYTRGEEVTGRHLIEGKRAVFKRLKGDERCMRERERKQRWLKSDVDI